MNTKPANILRINPVEKVETLKDGVWWVYEVYINLSDGTTKAAMIEGDGHIWGWETLEYLE